MKSVKKIIFFDTDYFSSFLWIKKEALLEKAFPDRLQIPRTVYLELSKVPHLQNQVNSMVNKKRELPTNTFSEYRTRKSEFKLR